MPWDLTLPPRHPAAFAEPIGLTAQAVAEASGAAITATNPPRAMTPAEKEEAAWAAGYGVGAATERRKLEAARAVKGSDEPVTKAPDAFSWDEIAAETNAQAGVSAPSQEA